MVSRSGVDNTKVHLARPGQAGAGLSGPYPTRALGFCSHSSAVVGENYTDQNPAQHGIIIAYLTPVLEI